MGSIINKITPNLWFDTQAEEAVNYYTAIFKNSSIDRISRYEKDLHGIPKGTVMNIEFKLEGQTFTALNGGPQFKFNESISFIVHCENQEEIDCYWDRLTEGSQEREQACGWLKDKFGVSWQIIPVQLSDLLSSSDQQKKERVVGAMLPMKKINLKALLEA